MAKQKKATSRVAAKTAVRKIWTGAPDRRQILRAQTIKSKDAYPLRKRQRPKRVKSKARPKQRIAISHHREEDFKADGLRSYAHYRDLGIAEASHGLAQAHVIRLIGPCNPVEVSKLHYHDVEFQMVYVLKGWVKTYMEGQGETLMKEGSAWTQPPRIKHLIMDYSDDVELPGSDFAGGIQDGGIGDVTLAVILTLAVIPGRPKDEPESRGSGFDANASPRNDGKTAYVITPTIAPIRHVVSVPTRSTSARAH
jgi:hypothetical protein